jgi:hypothetical protein
MSKHYWLVLVLAAVAALLPASSASGATTFGDACIGDDATREATTIFQIAAPGNPLPLAAPADGVITRWSSAVDPSLTFGIPQTLKILRVTGPTTAQVVAEDSTRSVTGSANAFDVRIPVKAGDRLGIFGPAPFGTILCESTDPGNRTGGFSGSAAVGESREFISVPDKYRLPVAATLEADADQDGYGDETQDKCPQDAAVQTACGTLAIPPARVPPVRLDAVPQAAKGRVVVLVATNADAPVTVAARVKVGKGKTANLTAGPAAVAAGQLGRFVLSFPKALKAKLAKLERKKSLVLTVTASATNSAGVLSTDVSTVKLKGQKK